MVKVNRDAKVHTWIYTSMREAHEQGHAESEYKS